MIHSLKELRDIGNSVIVVEHDKDMMLAADYVIDMGPKAGRLGGDVVFAGTPREMLRTHTLTSQYLNGERAIEVPAKRREGNGHSLWLRGAKGNNLKNVDVEFSLGKGTGNKRLTTHEGFRQWQVHAYQRDVAAYSFAEVLSFTAGSFGL